MSKELPSLTQIKACQSSPWDVGNNVLYNLCRENFTHHDTGQVLAKVWLIGRSYAAAIERRRNKKLSNDDFYIYEVAPAFMNSEIDHKMAFLKKFDAITPEITTDILETHYYLLQLVKSLTDLEKRSFCSKYLHFHLPNLFFIYDSRVVNALRKWKNELAQPIHFNKNVDQEYSKTFFKCLTIKRMLEEKHGLSISPRHLDTIFLNA